MDIINDKLYNEIVQYCKINQIDDIKNEINTILQIGFNVIRFGASPFQQTIAVPQEEDKNEEVKVSKKRGRKPKMVEVEAEKPLQESQETPKVKVRIIKNK